MPQSYLTLLGHFADFLLVYTHTLLYLRALYPPASFVRSRFHNTPVCQSRHPQVCAWVRDAVQAVHQELVKGTVARIGIVIYWYGGAAKAGSPKILERFMLDVSGFPVLDKEESNMPIEWENTGSDKDELEELDEEKAQQEAEDSDPDLEADTEANIEADMDANVDMAEQFRAALVMLTTRCSRLQPLPKNCSFNISMELKDDPEADPPLGHPHSWIPAQGSLQKTGRNAKTKDNGRAEGQDLGRVKVTPIRAVEAGVLRFDTWVEEGKAKTEHAASTSSAAG